MSISPKNNTHIFFINNYANHVGGAIYIEKKRIDIYKCFLWVVDIYYHSELNSKNLSLTFTNNTARNGGDAILFGGSLYYCDAASCHSMFVTGSSILILNYWNIVYYEVPSGGSNLSLISSEPTRVCLCDDGEPDCFSSIFTNDTRYPGETFTISAVVVGQGFGTTDGSVYASFLPLNKSSPATFQELQQSQLVNHRTCTQLKYSVLSANEKEVVALTARVFAVLEYPQHKLVDKIIHNYKFHKYKEYSVQNSIEELLSFPVFINISLLPCPSGFMLSSKPAKCFCHDTLQ